MLKYISDISWEDITEKNIICISKQFWKSSFFPKESFQICLTREELEDIIWRNLENRYIESWESKIRIKYNDCFLSWEDIVEKAIEESNSIPWLSCISEFQNILDEVYIDVFFKEESWEVRSLNILKSELKKHKIFSQFFYDI